MCKVAVLMSTYNGREYVEDQIRTIYEQDYSDFTLFIRDDGSNADFVKQLEGLQAKYGFELIKGENLGFVKSFLTLLKSVEGFKYYAFADQDDIWLPEKLSKGVAWFEGEAGAYAKSQGHQVKEISDLPVLYHSAYEVINMEGDTVDTFYFPNEGYDFRRAITENHYSGFSMIINEKMKKCLLEGRPEYIGYHDWWAAMIAQGFGVGYSDSLVTAMHRAHGDNVTTFNLGTRLKWLWRSLTGEQELHRRAVEFSRCFKDFLPEDKQKQLAWFVYQRYSFGKSIRKCFYPKRWRPVLSSELIMRVLMLFGRI